MPGTRETGKEVPKEPVIFMKAPSALCGPFDDPGDSKNSQEDGLGGSGAGVGDRKRASYVSEAEAMGHVAGTADERLQRAGFSNGARRPVGEREEFATRFAPLGPFLGNAR